MFSLIVLGDQVRKLQKPVISLLQLGSQSSNLSVLGRKWILASLLLFFIWIVRLQPVVLKIHIEFSIDVLLMRSFLLFLFMLEILHDLLKII